MRLKLAKQVNIITIIRNYIITQEFNKLTFIIKVFMSIEVELIVVKV